jgi:hypothetical protein
MSRIIKCLSLYEPWASLLASGRKKIETRSWKYKGALPVTLAIHAAKRTDCLFLCEREPFKSKLAEIGYESASQLPLGCVVGLVTIVSQFQFGHAIPDLSETERAFGDYSPGRWGFVTQDNRLLAHPVPARGSQLIWAWEPPAGELEFCEKVCPAPVVVPAGEPDLFGGMQ